MPQQATTGPALMEGIERTNVVVVRGQGQGAGQGVGAPLRRDPYAMEVDRGEIVMFVGDLGTWPATIKIKEEGGRWMKGGWNMVEEELRRFLTI